MRFHVVIPARFASTRLPGKPLINLVGRPLIAHVYDCALAAGADDIWVATDDERIASVCHDMGAPVIMTSPEHNSGSERLAEVVAKLQWPADDIVVNLQGDEPLTPSKVIRQVAQNLQVHANASVSTLCAPIHTAAQLNDPHTVKVICDRDGYALYFSRAPIPWERDLITAETRAAPIGWRHIGIYAYRAGYLQRYIELPPCDLEQIEKLEQLRVLWYGARIHVDEAIEEPGHGIDTPEDLKIVEALINQQSQR